MEKSKVDLYSFDSAARGYHVYRRIWNASLRIAERLESTQEDGNSKDRFAIALTKDDVTIGHVPRTELSMADNQKVMNLSYRAAERTHNETKWTQILRLEMLADH